MEHFDVIIVGSGIAGLNFALRAAEKYEHVLVITKKKVALSSTNFAQGGIAAVLSGLDNFNKHVRDTLVAGSFHNDRKAVKYMAAHGPAAVRRLMEMGVPFAMEQGRISLTREGGHACRRIAFVSDYTGQAIEEVLVRKIRNNRRIKLMEHTFAADLLVKNKICYGVQILRGKKFENIYADLTVLATGGMGQLYSHTTNPGISTGDGIAMASRAGCRLRDLEFVQFHPTALKLEGCPRFLISEAVRGEGAYLRNANGERFMLKAHKLAELAPRDVVAREIFLQGKKGPVYLDFTHKPKSFLRIRFPNIYKTLKSYGLDLSRDLIPVSPAAHFICGGIDVNSKGDTGIKNLYAFGETACTGVHGANRLASNSLLEALVFSDRILSAKPVKKKPPEFVLPEFSATTGAQRKKIQKFREKFRQIMWDQVGIIRNAKKLKKTIGEIKSIKKAISNIGASSLELLELKNMLQAGELIAKSALKRKQSLGCHYRSDATI